jgi:hypothetical protein
MDLRILCPDCMQPIVAEYAATFLLGTRCGCPEKHWHEQDKQWRAKRVEQTKAE